MRETNCMHCLLFICTLTSIGADRGGGGGAGRSVGHSLLERNMGRCGARVDVARGSMIC